MVSRDKSKMAMILCWVLACSTLQGRPAHVPHIWSNAPSCSSSTIVLPASGGTSPFEFAEVAELIKVLRLEIRGTISSRMLSPRTLYAAYLVFKLTGNYNGFELPRFEVGAGFVGDEAGKRERSVVYLSRSYASVRLCRWDIIPILPEERRDGWLEIELGDFLTKDVQDGEVEMSVQDARGNRWMVGLVVEGIEIRPKDRK